MFREYPDSEHLRGRFPHARGDVPHLVCVFQNLNQFSPRAWGCSGLDCVCPSRLQVFPTRVGMFRTHRTSFVRITGFPHARGDVPNTGLREGPHFLFSPRAWGCSVWVEGTNALPPVFPTRVGMFRPFFAPAFSESRFPHARGDVPVARTATPVPPSFSPRAWGCSGLSFLPPTIDSVFPTRVGMFRQKTRVDGLFFCFPHARGDVPVHRTSMDDGCMFSPRAWGCSGPRDAIPSRENVFPTRVGMFR